MKTPVIELKDVVKTHKVGEQEIHALRGVSLRILAGTYNMLLGPSGCGKSTLLSLVAGLDTPTSGNIKLRGENIAGLTVDQMAYHRRKRIGMVFQQFNLLSSLTVWENVALPYVFDGQPLKLRKDRALKLLGMVRMQDFAYRLPTQLSGGQQQKVAIVRALMNNPWILLVDEPTGNLDSVSAQEVMDFLQILNRKSKRTILLVTHNYEYVRYAERVIYMRDGQILTPSAAREVSHRMAAAQKVVEHVQSTGTAAAPSVIPGSRPAATPESGEGTEKGETREEEWKEKLKAAARAKTKSETDESRQGSARTFIEGGAKGKELKKTPNVTERSFGRLVARMAKEVREESGGSIPKKRKKKRPYATKTSRGRPSMPGTESIAKKLKKGKKGGERS